jgi:hypothetical protein
MTDNDLIIYEEQYYVLSATFNRLVPLFCADLAMLQSFTQAYGRPPNDRGYHVNGRAFSPPFLFGNHPINYVTLTGRCRDVQVLGGTGERGFAAVILSLTDDTGGQPIEAIYSRTDCVGPANGSNGNSSGSMKTADYLNKSMTLTGYLTRNERFNRTQMKLITAPDIFPASEAAAIIAASVKSSEPSSAPENSLTRAAWGNNNEDVLAEELRRTARTLQFRREVLARPWAPAQDDMERVLSGLSVAKSVAGALRPEEILGQIAAASDKLFQEITKQALSSPSSTVLEAEVEENVASSSAHDKKVLAEKRQKTSCMYDDDDGFEDDDGLSVTDSASNDENGGGGSNQGAGGLGGKKEGIATGLVLSRRCNVLELRDTGIYSSDVMSSVRWGASSDEEYGSDSGAQDSKQNEIPISKKRKVDSESFSREVSTASVSLEQQNPSYIKVPEVSGNSIVVWDLEEADGFTDIDNEELSRAVQEEEEQEELRASRRLTSGSSYIEKQPPPPGVVLPPSVLNRQNSTASSTQAQESYGSLIIRRQEGTKTIVTHSQTSISVPARGLANGSVLQQHQQISMGPARTIGLQSETKPGISTSTTDHIFSQPGTRANTHITTIHDGSKVNSASSVLIISDDDDKENEVVDWTDSDNVVDEQAPILASAVASHLQACSMPLLTQSGINNPVKQQPPPPGVDISSFGLLRRPLAAAAAKTFAYGEHDDFDDIDDIVEDLTDGDELIKEFEERKRNERKKNEKDTQRQKQQENLQEISAQSEEEGLTGTQEVVDWSDSDNELASESDGSASVAEVKVNLVHSNVNHLKSSPPPLPQLIIAESERLPAFEDESVALSTTWKSSGHSCRPQSSKDLQTEESARCTTPSLVLPKSFSVWSGNHKISKSSYIKEKRLPSEPQSPKHEQSKGVVNGLSVSRVSLQADNNWLPHVASPRNTILMTPAATTNKDDLIQEPKEPNSDDFIADAFSSTPGESGAASTAYHRMVAEPGSATRQRLGYCVLEFIRMQHEHRASRSAILYNSDLVHYTYIAQEHDPKNIPHDLTHEQILDEVLQKHAQHGYIFSYTNTANSSSRGSITTALPSSITESYYEALGAWNLMAPLTRILGTPIGPRQIKLAYLVDTLTKVRALRRRGVVAIAPPLVRDLVDGILGADPGVWASDRIGGVWYRQD